MSQPLAFHGPLWSVPERWLALRDRLLASPRFLRFARSFPLTRPVARRRARALFDLCAGFVYSQVLSACVRLKVFEALADSPLSVAELASRVGLEHQACEQLLRAAAALDLIEARRHDRFGLGRLGAALLANPGIAALIEHHDLFYSDLRDPVGLLRGDAVGADDRSSLASYWTYSGNQQAAALPADQVAGYSRLMAASQPMIAEEVIAAYPIEEHRCLLDVGGGDGAFLAAAAARAPRLKLMLFDLPAVVEQGRARFAAAGLARRTTVHGGNFFTDELPRGADLATLVRVIHDHNDDAALAILSAVRRALPLHGILLLAEPMAGAPGAEAVGDAYFAFYFRAMGRGRARTPRQLESLLKQAGFGFVHLLPTHMPLQTQVLMACARGPGRKVNP